MFQNLISKSKRPLVIVGNGINLSKTKNQLISFLEKVKFLMRLHGQQSIFFMMKKLMFKTQEFSELQHLDMEIFVQNADLLICFGTRLNTQLTGSNPKLFAPKAKKIIVDIDNSEFKKLIKLKLI